MGTQNPEEPLDHKIFNKATFLLIQVPCSSGQTDLKCDASGRFDVAWLILFCLAICSGRAKSRIQHRADLGRAGSGGPARFPPTQPQCGRAGRASPQGAPGCL